MEKVRFRYHSLRQSFSGTRSLGPTRDVGGEPFASSPTDFGKYIVEYTEKWSKIIRASNIKAE
jgi:hypothetical protein